MFIACIGYGVLPWKPILLVIGDISSNGHPTLVCYNEGLLYFYRSFPLFVVTWPFSAVAARSQAWIVFPRSNAGIVNSYPT
jgi:hypothetical protein